MAMTWPDSIDAVTVYNAIPAEIRPVAGGLVGPPTQDMMVQVALALHFANGLKGCNSDIFLGLARIQASQQQNGARGEYCFCVPYRTFVG